MRKELGQLCRRIENEVSEIKKIRDLALRRWQKAKRVLGFEAVGTLGEGIRKEVEWLEKMNG